MSFTANSFWVLQIATGQWDQFPSAGLMERQGSFFGERSSAFPSPRSEWHHCLRHKLGWTNQTSL